MKSSDREFRASKDRKSATARDFVPGHGGLSKVMTDSVWKQISKDNPQSYQVNVLELLGHAGPSGSALGLSSKKDVENFAKFLSNVNWNENGIILVSGCNSGAKKNDSFCQLLANATGKTVYGTLGNLSGGVLTNPDSFKTRSACWVKFPNTYHGITGLDSGLDKSLRVISFYFIPDSEENIGAQGDAWLKFAPN